MSGVGRPSVFMFHRWMHTSSSYYSPSVTLKKKIAQLEKIRKRKNPKKDQLFVQVPDSLKWLDTATWPLIISTVGIAAFAKILMMYDDSKSQETIERKIKNAPEGQGTVRMLSREEWEDIKDLPPRTPFESKFARTNARIRTEEHLRLDDLKDWTVDVLTDALSRAEESVKNKSKSV
ncbi:uncharacterized protein LOC124926851 [Impatiens glandulifera]|uniref:uncharacterized protein LOC124926851 n=1 Tax=Impatiens glandulifera TaxID=253017 RepID=UPI001FB11ED6|nr:uncharacterized protein LOC124926851 [Impatiens glandulifera]